MATAHDFFRWVLRTVMPSLPSTSRWPKHVSSLSPKLRAREVPDGHSSRGRTMKLYIKEHGSGRGKKLRLQIWSAIIMWRVREFIPFCPVPMSMFFPLLQMLHVQSKTVLPCMWLLDSRVYVMFPSFKKSDILLLKILLFISLNDCHFCGTGLQSIHMIWLCHKVGGVVSWSFKESVSLHMFLL